MDEEQLAQYMQQSQQGDGRAYNHLLHECAAILRAYIRNRINAEGDVEDIVQEILLSLHKARHTYDPSKPFKPWLFAIAKFRLTDYLRKIYRKRQHDEAHMDDLKQFFSEMHVTQSADQNELFNRIVHGLPEKQQHIITLLHVDGYTAKEVAAQLGMSESAVKVSAHRVYKKLKEQLKDMI